LSLVELEPLDDDQLIAFYHRCHDWGVRAETNRVARLIDQRPSLLAKGAIEPIALYGDLALDAAQRNNRGEADKWLARGRESDPLELRSQHALAWELVALQVRTLVEEPDEWVPHLAALLERYRGNQDATTALLLRLSSLGLVQIVVDPNRPDHVILDTRVLENLLSRYGPRVTTAAGQSGVAASRGEIWTPDSAPGGSSIWTPGSASPPIPDGGKPKIIYPGR
jgi:hypothetical protein